MHGLMQVSYFLLGVFFNLLFLALWSRFAVRFFNVSALHPVAQSIYRLTNPIFYYFSFIKINSRKIDVTCLFFIIIAEFIKFALFFWLFLPLLPITFIPIYVLADLFLQPLNLLFYAIILRIILSFVSPTLYSPFRDFLKIITEPLIRPIRKVISDRSGFDFAPYLTLILLKVIDIFISNSLPVNIF